MTRQEVEAVVAADQDLYALLTRDDERNQLIVEDV